MTKGYKQVDGEYLDKNGRHVSTIKAVYIVELEERIASLEAALQRIKYELSVPAAEYVPAIRDVFGIVDEALK